VRPGTAILALLLVTLAAGTVRSAASAPESFEQCDAFLQEHPEALEPYLCYWLLARKSGDWDTATRRIDALLALDPANPRALFARGSIAHNRGEERAEELYRSAIAGFSAEGEVAGEIRARTTLAELLQLRGRLEQAGAELERALRLAEEAGDEARRIDALIALGWQRYNQADFGSARSLLRQAEVGAFDGGSRHQRIEVLDGLAASAWALGRHAEALDLYRRELELLGDADAFRESGIRRNISLVAQSLATAGEIGEEELLRVEREALDAALRAGNRYAEVGARLMLARTLPGEAGLAEGRRALALARELRSYRDTCWALWLLSERIHRLRPERAGEALRLADEAVEASRERGDFGRLATGLAVRAGLHWRVGDEVRGVEDGLAALEAIEKVRDHQPDLDVRARVFSRFSDTYRNQITWLLHRSATEGLSPEGAELAFAISERLRARSLLDVLDAAGASAALAPRGPAAEERRAVLGEIASVQKDLLRARLGAGERQDLLARLEELERDEAGLRDRIAREDPRFSSLRAPEVPSLRDLRAALDEDQALLSFIVGPEVSHAGDEDGAVSWVVAVSGQSVEVFPLPSREVLDREIRAYRALLERRDGSEREGAARLHRELLDGPLASLPPGVRRLLILPDGPLHRLSFASLRPFAEGEPAAARYEIQLLPSATAWMRWRRQEAPSGDGSLLSLADPDLGGESEEGGLRSAGVFASELRLGPLPHARREARALRRDLGSGSRVLAGGEASEHALKTGELSRYQVLHLAAHAVVDDEHPDRSAVLLAPGAPEEDGLLQYREVVDLDLEGQVVLLSACSSASGPVVGGEGVMGLANAFFQAGARAVVAGLWPLRDDEAADLVDQMGRRLARGQSLGAALAGARRALIERGAPTAAWAGLVVLGDADVVPLPGGGGVIPRLARLAAAPLLLGLAAAGLFLLLRRGRALPAA
jgi:CHAT domain-containing protein/Tfp pilus assembly protein PilF